MAQRVVPQEESADLRNLGGAGDYHSAENALHMVFQPLVGYKACWLYMTLCRMVPLAQYWLTQGTRMKLTQEVLATSCGMAKSTVQRELEVLVAVGMVLRHQPSMRRCATYQLPNLKVLAGLGTEVLESRLRDPQRVLGLVDEVADEPQNAVQDSAESRTVRVIAAQEEPNTPQSAVRHPERKGKPGDPHRVTERKAGLAGESVRDEDSGSPVTQKRGVGDPQAGLLYKTQELRQSTPIAPRGADGEDLELSFEACRPGDTEFAARALAAAHWVMDQEGLLRDASTTRRMPKTLVGALTIQAKATRQTLGELARMAVANWNEYREAKGQFAGKLDRFMASGDWCRPERWVRREAGRPDAGVGRWDGKPVVPGTDTREHDAAYLEGRAATIEVLGLWAVVAPALRSLAGKIREGKRPADLEEKLDGLECSLIVEIQKAIAPDEFKQMRAEATAAAAPYRGRMSESQFADVVDRKLDEQLLAKAGVPRLSLFYAHEATK